MTSYYDICYERKEMAWLKFKNSGYKDLTAEREFQHYYQVCQKLLELKRLIYGTLAQLEKRYDI